MKIKDLSFILVRVLALYMIIRGLEHFVNIIQIMYPFFIQGLRAYSAIFLIIFVSSVTGFLMLGVGLLIWTKTVWIVNLISRDDQMTSEEAHTAQNQDWYTLGLTLVGIYVFVESVPNLISLFGQLFQYRADHLETFVSQRQQVWLQIGVIVVKLILAVILVFKAAGLSGLLAKIRGLGLRNE